MGKYKMNIAIKFGYDNRNNNYYEFYNVKDFNTTIIGGEKYLTFTYFGKRSGTRNEARFPQKHTWIIVKDLKND